MACTHCNNYTQKVYATGYALDLGKEGYDEFVWCWDEACTNICAYCPDCKAELTNDDFIYGGGDRTVYQNFVDFKPNRTPFEEDASVDFWPGRKILIDLTKKIMQQ